MNEKEITSNAKIPLISDEEYNVLDTELHSMIDEVLKLNIKDKGFAIAQYIIKKQDEENQKIKEKLKQRDEVIDEAINWIIKYTQDWTGDEVEEDMLRLLKILQKHKGDNR